LRRAPANLKPAFLGLIFTRAIAPPGKFVYFHRMTFRHQFWFSTFAIWLGVVLGGCEPSSQSALDDEKEPHFILGQSRVNSMNYQGAIEAFEESLEADPHSAQAHYQLAMLYENKESDPAAAIYHYQQFLRFNPDAENAEIITQHIASCKQQLAADVLAMPGTPAAIKQIEDLTEKNRQLQSQVDGWIAYYKNQPAMRTNNFAAPENNLPPPQTQNPTPAQTEPIAPVNPKPPVNATQRTHVVAAGETESAIARKFGIKLSALQAANPGLNPSKLRIGQPLNIPPP
jgi:LysM repeat protein